MSVFSQIQSEVVPSTVVMEGLKDACARIAPSWPLDQSIAVNPWWEYRSRPFETVSAELAALAQVHCLMPNSHYQQRWLSGQIQAEDLACAAKALNIEASIEELVSYLQQPQNQIGHWHNVSDFLDGLGDRVHHMPWQDEITQQVSQLCAEYFQPGSPFSELDQVNLYREWLSHTRKDRGLEILMDEPQLRQQFQRLPVDVASLIAEASEELIVDALHSTHYFSALLLDINGWASWMAYLRWQAKLNGNSQHQLVEELLGIRLAWDLALWRHYKQQHNQAFCKLEGNWRQQWLQLPALIDCHRQAQQFTWVWLRASEVAYQTRLNKTLLGANTSTQNLTRQLSAPPLLQAVFCIDVRSEPMRRALEAQDDRIETLGFAGFFGLPLQYQPQGTDYQRPQLPGLLKPVMTVTEATVTEAGEEKSKALTSRQYHIQKIAGRQRLQDASPATFSLVEATGLSYAFKLFKNTFSPPVHTHPVNKLAQHSKAWDIRQNGELLTVTEKARLAKNILQTMGLTKNYARTILLVGHGSESCNNPHAAGLDCGACGGQTGEINVRVLSSLLNDVEIRQALLADGITIPDQSRFVAALHNTTTDKITCFDPLPDSAVEKWLGDASSQARRIRAAEVDITGNSDATLSATFQERSHDWSQVRPEWGLANNASFIIAPRAFTKHVDLSGRTFLHDYQWCEDEQFRTLETIMTAPMIVTNWINMQYNASVTDNLKYGAGNKVLHNVVGGNLGVFEGNGGDLRIGLPWQSLNNGKQWMHEPLRLSVYIAAPQEAITNIIDRHEVIADLVNNHWLYIFQWDTANNAIARYDTGHWSDVGRSVAA